jgi:arginyl-tRNA synthetase
MNIFENYLKSILEKINNHYKELGINKIENNKGIILEKPPSNFDCDISSNVVLILAKQNKCNPITLGNNIKKILEKNIKDFKNIEIAGPGFLNISLKNEALTSIINDILKKNGKFGSQNDNKNYNIEFVSANPTGPMHVGHCRGAIFGDTLSNLLKFNGNKVTKEYYINDYGGQIINFLKSVYLRIREIKYKEKFPNDKSLYPGEYIIEIADSIQKKRSTDFKSFDDEYEFLYKEALNLSMQMIKSDLSMLGISHDNFISEKSIVESKTLDNAINLLKKTNYVVEGYLDPPKGEEIKDWKKTKRLLFKSTLFGDDSNRALQKNDGTWTYFANDIAYHFNKVSRNYDKLINVLGADHTGYIKRIESAVKALSQNKTILECKVCQLVKLFKNGEPFKMSKRAGDFISVNDLLSEVNKDSIRFMMLNRSNDVELDFDFDKVLEKSKDNPVYYVQYCHARIKSLLRSTNSTSLKEKIVKIDKEFNKHEREILRKIFEWPKIVKISSNKCEPHRIPFYLYELATLFHSYWSKGNEDEKYKFIKNGKISNNNILTVISLLLLVLKNGMGILNVSLPDKM